MAICPSSNLIPVELNIVPEHYSEYISTSAYFLYQYACMHIGMVFFRTSISHVQHPLLIYTSMADFISSCVDSIQYPTD